MSAESDADRLVYFDVDDFGVEARIVGKIVRGIFDARYGEAEEVGGSVPEFRCRTLDLPSVVDGDQVYVCSANYKIVGPPQEDGTGITYLRLESQ